MALTMLYRENIDGREIEHKRAYFKVSTFNGTKASVHFNVSIFEDKAQKRGLATYVYSFVPSVNSGAENIIEQAYKYLKTRPEYAGAEDC